LRERYPWVYFKTHAQRPVEITIVVYALSQKELEKRVEDIVSELVKVDKISGVECL